MTESTPRDRALAGEVVKVSTEMHRNLLSELIAARKEIERLTRDNRAMRGLLAEGPDSDDLVNARLARIKSGEDK